MRTGWLIALVTLAPTFAEPAAPVSPPIRVEYRPPRNPVHQPLYEAMREHRFLEELAAVLAPLRLPRPLTLYFVGCDGNSNAFYEAKYTAIVFCYELLDDIRKAATANRTKMIVPMQDAVYGPTVFILFHETGHAVFDLLRVPVLGRLEDAADCFAAITLLRMGEAMAYRMVAGAAWAYGHAAAGATLDMSDLADIHSLDSQRYYNLLCLTYGSDPQRFAGLVNRGFLPRERAERCVDEYRQALYAIQKLVIPPPDERPNGSQPDASAAPDLAR